jgi:hypothetical protein
MIRIVARNARQEPCFCLAEVVPPAGFEPATPASGVSITAENTLSTCDYSSPGAAHLATVTALAPEFAP